MCIVETFADEIFINEAGHKIVRQLYRTKRGKEKYRYVSLVSCAYCEEDFVPTRRGVHKYCSNSCRSRACKERNGYVNGQKVAIKPSEELQPVSAVAQEQWSWMRTGENAAASGAVATVQYYAIENMITDKLGTITNEIRLSEQRNAQRMKAFIEASVKQASNAPKQYKSIDTKDFEEMGRKLL
ncbi:hypothetical protein WJR50_33715 [Catalinimonas sp. 4WD22]|uniref:hypothetical protein n=1 Tax=Catalinimonas locisalis TaxID=3133978 RepID=UPI003100F2C5